MLAMLAQIGPFATPPSAPRPAVEGRQGHGRPAPRVAKPPPRGALQVCLDESAGNPAAAIARASAWLARSEPLSNGEPQLCLGSAYSALGRWQEAEAVFVAGRDSARGGNARLRGKLGAMAGNAALASGSPERALGLLDTARGEAQAAAELPLAGEIAIDRARALVMLKRNDEAAKALVEARTSAPDSAFAWLLSATLSRRMGKLGQAQAQIATAAGLDPRDPEIGLEAGVIAVLDGRAAAARQSWQSAIDLAPGSDTAKTARGYLDQLGPPAASPKK